MKPALEHPWDLTRTEAEQLQNELRLRVITSNQIADVRTVAGVDLGFAGGNAQAAIVVLSYPTLEMIEISTAQRPVSFPYIPGLLSFREIPAILEAAERLRCEPDLLICDGQGIAHPRRFGFTAHLGVLLDKPSIGCAKSRLIGAHAPVGPLPGDRVDLSDNGELVGAVLRTKSGSKPLFISIGHKIDLSSSITLVSDCCRGYRLPEPTRLAHLAAGGRLAMGV